MRSPFVIAAFGLGLVAAAAQAQAIPGPMPMPMPMPIPGPTPATRSPEEARAALNGEEAAFAQHQLAEDATDAQAYQAAMARRAAAIHHERMAYAARMRRYHEAMRQWHADVAACHAGDLARCAGPAGAGPTPG